MKRLCLLLYYFLFCAIMIINNFVNNLIAMKKIYACLSVILALSAVPALAATSPAKATWKPATPSGYTAITWAKAPGIASFFRAPDGGGSIDFLTRIYLPQNQIGFIIPTSTPIDLGSANPNFLPETQTISNPATDGSDGSVISNDFRNLSFERLGAEAAKGLSSSVKFIWNAPYFNMKPLFSDLSMAVKYSVGTSTVVSSGARSVSDMAQPRKMLIINNKTGLAKIEDFDSTTFIDSKAGDQALEGFAPTVLKSDSANATAARLFLGVTRDGKELVIYCSQQATAEEASNALLTAGIALDNQLQADGGGSASCGYNLPGQFFVEPTRTVPLLMGATPIVAMGTVINKSINVRGGASTKFPIVAQLAKGDVVRALEEKSGWYRIGDGQWILKTLVK